MASVYKNSQKQGTANLTTYDTLYSTASSVTAVISSIIVTNTSGVTKQYKLAIMNTAGTPAALNWIVYNGSIAPNDAVALTLGITLMGGQFLRFSSTDSTVTFSAYISEIS